MAKWTTKYKDRLPDDAFVGMRFGLGRKLPVINHMGQISINHVNNALARSNQVLFRGKRISKTLDKKIDAYLRQLQRKYYRDRGEPCPKTSSGCKVRNPRATQKEIMTAAAKALSAATGDKVVKKEVFDEGPRGSFDFQLWLSYTNGSEPLYFSYNSSTRKLFWEDFTHVTPMGTYKNKKFSPAAFKKGLALPVHREGSSVYVEGREYRNPVGKKPFRLRPILDEAQELGRASFLDGIKHTEAMVLSFLRMGSLGEITLGPVERQAVWRAYKKGYRKEVYRWEQRRASAGWKAYKKAGRKKRNPVMKVRGSKRTGFVSYKYMVYGARGAVYETTTLKEAKRMAGKTGKIVDKAKRR